jgi:hypothetical protein
MACWSKRGFFLFAQKEHPRINKYRPRKKVNHQQPNNALEPTAVGAFRLATSHQFAPPQFGGSSAFVR